MASGQRLPRFREEQRPRARIPREAGSVCGDRLGQPGGYGETLFGKTDGRRDKISPWQAPMCPMGGLQHPQRARHADGAATDHGIEER
jgi:hypothetical protein